MDKFIKKNKDIIILSIILIILVVFMALTTTTFSYFSKATSAGGQIQLGELDYEIVVNNMPVDKLMPGDDINIDVSVVNAVNGKTNLVPFYFRFKIFNNNENYSSQFITLTSGDNFILDNNYYYYKYKVNSGNSVRLIRNLQIDTALTQEDAENIDIEMLVEAVQSEYGAYEEVFDDAPQAWIDFIENN